MRNLELCKKCKYFRVSSWTHTDGSNGIICINTLEDFTRDRIEYESRNVSKNCPYILEYTVMNLSLLERR
jgi:hypothetical protein